MDEKGLVRYNDLMTSTSLEVDAIWLSELDTNCFGGSPVGLLKDNPRDGRLCHDLEVVSGQNRWSEVGAVHSDTATLGVNIGHLKTYFK